MTRTLRNIIKSYDMITEEGAKSFEFFFIFYNEETYDIEKDTKTLEELRKIVKESNSRMLDEKICETKSITRFLTAIVVFTKDIEHGSLFR